MRSLATLSLLAITAAGLGWSLVGIFTLVMKHWRRLDQPNERSMHSQPVPAGAGIGIVATVLLLWPGWHTRTQAFDLALLAGCVALGLLSLADDHRRLSPALRLGAQATVVAACLLALPSAARLVEILPLTLERGLIALAWLWFINLFNFMDGIDGLAGSETVAVAIGYLAVAAFAGLDDPFWRLALVIAASVGGYLFWNWHPALVFMGDAGSIPLGFLLGWLMLDLALAGEWPAALILPLYFMADATLTLLARARRGEALWQAHRQHFYQRAVLGGTTPSGVVRRVSAVNAALLALALLSVHHPLPALVVAAALVWGLLAHLTSLARRRS
ncbi:MAG TPA: glycosyltransferase family 4 protein [Hyphomicrobiaceae bacterium]|jgi:UDP-N-acetylmuramyl pentapeptide phosphotransferase/UDP-N-acetylglucosamine-1-phosphate transferase